MSNVGHPVNLSSFLLGSELRVESVVFFPSFHCAEVIAIPPERRLPVERADRAVEATVHRVRFPLATTKR